MSDAGTNTSYALNFPKDSHRDDGEKQLKIGWCPCFECQRITLVMEFLLG